MIVGPTASGKSALAVALAKKFNGEVISADSRQIYKGLDIGTGKITKKEMSGVPHHMLDIASPRRVYTADAYKKDVEKILKKIWAKNKLPILCGGTGFYIDTLIYNLQFPEVPANKKLRDRLSKLSSEKLFKLLLAKDPARAKSIDRNNKIRLIRALEIVDLLGKVPHVDKNKKRYDSLIIGIKTDSKKLKEKINKRLLARIKKGMAIEALKLHANGLSWKRMEELGLEYRYMARYLQGLVSKEQMIAELNAKIWHYARRQMTWWRKNKDIVWVGVSDEKKINKLVRDFM